MSYIDLHKIFKIQIKQPPYNKYFSPNAVQRHYMKNWTTRDIILKARQLGVSTGLQLGHLNTSLLVPDIKCATHADIVPNAQELFQKIIYAYENLPPEVKIGFLLDTNNTSKMTFKHVDKYGNPHPSSIVVSSSARSATVQRLHISEMAHMRPLQKKEVITGSLQAVPISGYAAIETTANGQEEVYDLWVDAVAGKNEWTPHFYNWAWNPEYQTDLPDKYLWKLDYKNNLAKRYSLIKDVQDRFKLTDEQYYWYYLKVRELKEIVMQEYPTIPEEAFLSTGSMVFNSFGLQQIKVKEPIDYLYDGNLIIWKIPEEGESYCIGVDTSEGDINSDYCVGGVLNARTGEQVAELHGRWIDHVFASLLAKLGQYYNVATIGVERNNHGHSVINSLVNQEEYPDVFRYSKLEYNGDDKYGWPTTAKTKPLMLTGAGGLVEAVGDELMIVNSEGFISEARVFKYLTTSRQHGMGAEDGKHDDRVMAWAIAWMIREVAITPNVMVG